MTRYNIPQEIKDAGVARVAKIMLQSDDDRAAIKAFNSLVTAERQNQLDAHHIDGEKVLWQMQIESAESIQSLAKQMNEDGEWLKYRRTRACRSDTKPGSICQVRVKGVTDAVPDGPPSGEAGRSTNGSGNGRK